MTTRLYYTDAYQTTFTATLTALTIYKGHPAAILEQSYFYPTSGGQPFDTGRLGDQPVVDVVAAESGELLHLLAGGLPATQIGQPIQGMIDWPRRYDHMQQHSGQHLLSQIFYRLFNAETVSVHFGDSESTLDLDTVNLEPSQLAEAERSANELVYAALPIKSYFVSDRELPSVPLRRPPKVTGQIRIVEIEQFDYSACGGTHVRTTGEIGPIKLTKQERRRNQVRLTFLCGYRALRDYQEKHRWLMQAASLFSNDIAQVPLLIERSQAQIKDLQRAVDTLTTQLLGFTAERLAQQAEPLGAFRLIARQLDEYDANALKTLATQLQQQDAQGVVLLASAAGGKLTLLFARGPAADQLHMGNLLRDTLAQVGGKGGGRPDFAQGGSGQPETAAAVLADAVRRVKEVISNQ
jgi:alanyl-tRNA synthetase